MISRLTFFVILISNVDSFMPIIPINDHISRNGYSIDKIIPPTSPSFLSISHSTSLTASIYNDAVEKAKLDDEEWYNEFIKSTEDIIDTIEDDDISDDYEDQDDKTEEDKDTYGDTYDDAYDDDDDSSDTFLSNPYSPPPSSPSSPLPPKSTSRSRRPPSSRRPPQFRHAPTTPTSKTRRARARRTDSTPPRKSRR